MKTTCPSCKRVYDIREAAVLAGFAAIIAKRRRKAGHQLTSEQARALQARGVQARRSASLAAQLANAVALSAIPGITDTR